MDEMYNSEYDYQVATMRENEYKEKNGFYLNNIKYQEPIKETK